jgi:hypothetical protein
VEFNRYYYSKVETPYQIKIDMVEFQATNEQCGQDEFEANDKLVPFTTYNATFCEHQTYNYYNVPTNTLESFFVIFNIQGYNGN